MSLMNMASPQSTLSASSEEESCPKRRRRSLRVSFKGSRTTSKGGQSLKLASSEGMADIEDCVPRFSDEDARAITSRLLCWYDRHHRKLPWRHKAVLDSSFSGEKDEMLEVHQQRRAYATWVSEMMLQQTRVATVIDYFNRWMEKWPSLRDLAAATEEEVNTLWAGLGYYRRARFLLEGARQIADSFKGSLPSTADELQKIRGIGKYTAGAIASIAFGEPVPVVDGNVVRVLCRLKAISENPQASSTTKTLWSLANQLVDEKRPGDLNQALMELGATLCSRSSPGCTSCPLQEKCKGFALFQETKGSAKPVLVTDFPVKIVKSSPRQEYVAVCVLERSAANGKGGGVGSQFLLFKRPETGLLAGLWEFPTANLEGANASVELRKAAIDHHLKDTLGLQLGRVFHVIDRQAVGTYTHVFTHIRMHMAIEWVHIQASEHDEGLSVSPIEELRVKWVSGSALMDMGLTTGVKKVYQMFLEFRQGNVIKGGSKAKKRRQEQERE